MSEQETSVEQEKPANQIEFGFTCFVTDDGQVFVERRTDIYTVPVKREATLIEVRRHLSEILMDLQAQTAAEYVYLKLRPAADDMSRRNDILAEE